MYKRRNKETQFTFKLMEKHMYRNVVFRNMSFSLKSFSCIT